MTRRLIPSVLGLLLLVLVVPSGAAAAPWTCQASVARGTLGPGPPVEPVTANKDAAACATQTAGGSPPPGLPGGATGSLLLARTRADGDTVNPAGQALAAPTGDLLGIRALDARVTGQCSGGQPLISGTWSIAGLTVLGIPIGTDRAVSRSLTIDSRSIDPSNIDPAAIAPA